MGNASVGLPSALSIAPVCATTVVSSKNTVPTSCAEALQLAWRRASETGRSSIGMHGALVLRSASTTHNVAGAASSVSPVNGAVSLVSDSVFPVAASF